MSTQGVYFICVEGRKNLVKIGMSKDCERRIKQLQTGNPDRLYIYRTIRSDKPYAVETSLHRFYKDAKYEKGGGNEWYKVSKEKIDRIIINYEKGEPVVIEKETWTGYMYRGLKGGAHFIGGLVWRK